MLASTILLSSAVTLLCLGDSVTLGVGLPQADRNSHRFCAVAQDLLGIVTETRGCGGSTTLDWQPDAAPSIVCGLGGAWQDLSGELIESDFVHILLGLNDATGWYEPCTIFELLPLPSGCPIRPNEYRGNLESIVEALPSDTVVLLSSPPDPPVWRDESAVLERLADYRESIRKLVQRYPNVCLGVDAWTELPESAFVPDDIHLNAQGHELLGRALANRIAELTSIRGRHPLPHESRDRDRTPSERWQRLCDCGWGD